MGFYLSAFIDQRRFDADAYASSRRHARAQNGLENFAAGRLRCSKIAPCLLPAFLD
jgi:hypothetical protein